MLISQNFTPFSALLGGVLIGLAASLTWVMLGRIAGISGILARAELRRLDWRAGFLLGLFLAGFLVKAFVPGLSVAHIEAGYIQLVLAGLLVGFGTRLGNGCTSGHGVCGIGRGSPRSIAATLVFVASGMVTVFLWR